MTRLGARRTLSRNMEIRVVSIAQQSYNQAPDQSALVEHGHYVSQHGRDVRSPPHTKDVSGTQRHNRPVL